MVRSMSCATAVVGVDVNERIREYVVRLIEASREPAAFGLPDLTPLIEFGASPRAAVFLARAAQAYAFIQGRDYVVPEDVKRARTRRPAPPPDPDVRGRGAVGLQRAARHAPPRRRRAALARPATQRGHTSKRCSPDHRGPRRGAARRHQPRAAGTRAAHRDPHAPPRQRADRRRLPLGLPRHRHRVRRRARVHRWVTTYV